MKQRPPVGSKVICIRSNEAQDTVKDGNTYTVSAHYSATADRVFRLQEAAHGAGWWVSLDHAFFISFPDEIDRRQK